MKRNFEKILFTVFEATVKEVTWYYILPQNKRLGTEKINQKN